MLRRHRRYAVLLALLAACLVCIVTLPECSGFGINDGLGLLGARSSAFRSSFVSSAHVLLPLEQPVAAASMNVRVS